MKKCSLFSYILEDDETETGGTSCENETLLDFCQEADLMGALMNGDIKTLNKGLVECGIKKIDRRRLFNGWQVAIDLTHEKEENKNIVNSPLFRTEEKADKWYRSLDFSTCELSNLDIIMLHYKDGNIDDTYLLG